MSHRSTLTILRAHFDGRRRTKHAPRIIALMRQLVDVSNRHSHMCDQLERTAHTMPPDLLYAAQAYRKSLAHQRDDLLAELDIYQEEVEA